MRYTIIIMALLIATPAFTQDLEPPVPVKGQACAQTWAKAVAAAKQNALERRLTRVISHTETEAGTLTKDKITSTSQGMITSLKIEHSEQTHDGWCVTITGLASGTMCPEGMVYSRCDARCFIDHNPFLEDRRFHPEINCPELYPELSPSDWPRAHGRF